MQIFKKFTESENVSYQTLDKCLFIAFRLLLYKKYNEVNQFTFSINSENSILTIFDNHSGKEFDLRNFGNKAILEAKKTIWAYIYLVKNNPDEFEKKYTYLIEDRFDEYIQYLKEYPYKPSPKEVQYEKDYNSRILIGEDEDIDTGYGPLEYGQYCGACESSPCMCSDPERTSMVYSW